MTRRNHSGRFDAARPTRADAGISAFAMRHWSRGWRLRTAGVSCAAAARGRRATAGTTARRTASRTERAASLFRSSVKFFLGGVFPCFGFLFWVGGPSAAVPRSCARISNYEAAVRRRALCADTGASLQHVGLLPSPSRRQNREPDGPYVIKSVLCRAPLIPAVEQYGRHCCRRHQRAPSYCSSSERCPGWFRSKHPQSSRLRSSEPRRHVLAVPRKGIRDDFRPKRHSGISVASA